MWNVIRYSLYAPIYDSIVGGFAEQRKQSIEGLELKPGEKVLIVGCGTGLDLPYIPQGVDITAGDITPAMVKRARKRGIAADIRVMDGQKLDLPDSSFDAVVLHLILAVIPDPIACIKEVHRVLKPGGRIAIFDKFLGDEERASPLRKAASAVARVVATDLNRRLGPILEAGNLELLSNEPARFNGLFRLAKAKKSPSPG
jgi:phosphatidylethanolamine/phosphatidyl-N-methylethanolamine N-methyltransferase